MRRYSPLLLIAALAANAQTAKPPVVFLNGYQSSCSGSQFSNTFGKFDQFFQATGRTTLFFDNCAYGGKPTIEELGNDFRDYLAGLKFPEVDIVAHSMGGLIVRSYLAGKQPAADVYLPPANPGIRKIVFLATPNFGSPIAILFGVDNQGRELASGGPFVFDLGTWNQGTDDLRGIDALALVGNVGTGQAVTPGFDDGVVGLTSASIGFAEPGHTRIIPYCHTGPGLVSIAGLCPANAPGIGIGVNATDPNVAATLSFLNDTSAWMSIGQAAEQNSFLSTGGGLIARAKSADDQYLAIQSAKASKDLNIQNSAIAWTDLLPAGPQDLMITTPSGTLDAKFVLQPGYTTALTVKSGPFITRVLPSAAALSPLAVAPGMIVAIYGSGLDGVQVAASGTPLTLLYVSATQVNGIVPDSVQGLTKFTATNGTGKHTVNVLVQTAVPAIYSQNQAGTGPAAALNALNNVLVTSTTPLRPSDYVSLYLTGLGTVHTVGTLQIADAQPTVTVGGKPCRVSYAGRAPGFPGLDQVNCQLAPDVAPTPNAQVAVSSSGRTSNVPTLAIQ